VESEAASNSEGAVGFRDMSGLESGEEQPGDDPEPRPNSEK